MRYSSRRQDQKQDQWQKQEMKKILGGRVGADRGTITGKQETEEEE